MSVLEQLANGLGDKPSRIVTSGFPLTMADLQRVVEVRPMTTADEPSTRTETNEIWPLISHHGFNRESLFGLGERGNIHQKTLTLLLAHDGLVASDPLIDIERAWFAGQREQALITLQTVVQQVARVESLIEKKYLRFEASRPTLTDASRQSILDLFGISPDLLVFVNFEQAFPDVQRSRRINEADYLSQVKELYSLMNLECPQMVSAEEGRGAITELASAVILVSWQLAVCAQDPSCDLTLSRNLEHRVFDEIVVRSAGQPNISQANRKRGKTRHVNRLAMGALPNLDAVGLSVADAIALRRDNAFENFREELRDAMNHLPIPFSDGQLTSEAEAAFEEQMRGAARKLREATKRSSFKGRVKQVSVPAAVGFVSSAAFAAPAGLTPSIFAGTATYAGVTIAQWLQGRRRVQGEKVAVRYFSSLGGDVSPP